MANLGVDIGASKITFVILKDGRISVKKKIPVPGTKKSIIKAVKEELSFAGKEKIKKIGIGIPGPLNQKADLVLNPPNLKFLKNCPLAGIIEKETGVKTLMDNDANCFALGEAVLGAGKGKNIVLGITLGSGVGGGLIVKGKIYRGAFGSALEAGHVTINYLGPECSCGGKGCLEEYCSRRFFLRKGKEPEEIFKKAKKGDKESLKIFEEYGKYLGIGLSNIINIVDPDLVIIGGGISGAYPFFIKAAKKEIKKRVISSFSKKYVKIKKAALGEFAGAVGAAKL
jgi:glucokinase